MKNNYLKFKIFGFTFIFGKGYIGNCIWPSIHFAWKGMSKPVSSHRPLTDEFRNRMLSMHRGQAHLEKAEERLAERLEKPETFTYNEWLTFTFRTSIGSTKISWRGGFRFSCNSEHIAFRLGKSSDAPHGQIWTYNGKLGSHHLV